jgi:aminodeoxyfutalosine deaminase
MADGRGRVSGTELHRAPVVIPVGAPPLTDGAVVVARGRIVDVGPHDQVSARHPDAARIEWDGVLTPGLVNAHTHLQYTDMAVVGRGAYDGFETWMSAFMEQYVLAHDWAASAAEGARQALVTGTTAVAEIVTDPQAVTATHDAGLHGVTYWEVLGWTDDAWAEGGRAAVEHQLRAIPEPPVAGISPHAIYSLDTGVLRELSALAAELGVRQHIHAAESAWEDAYVRSGTGDLAERWRANGRGGFALLRDGGVGHGVIAYLDSVGALAPSTHLAHVIYVDADDRRMLRERGVSVALCPRSNAVIGLDQPPVAAYLTEGNPISVGTDSLSSSPSLHLLHDVAALHRIAREQGYTASDLHARLFTAATAGGARALGLDTASGPRVAPSDPLRSVETDHSAHLIAPTGVLREGYRADLAVFPVGSADPADALAELVEAPPAAATATIVGGVARHDPEGRTRA